MIIKQKSIKIINSIFIDIIISLKSIMNIHNHTQIFFNIISINNEYIFIMISYIHNQTLLKYFNKDYK